ncbi:MAG TPA: SirB2 family protein [Steroidobacteraceae bacterium]
MALYPDVKAVHVTAAAMSGTFFLLRGLAVQLRARWPHAAPARYLSYVIDTLLLVAGVTLATILPRAMFANGWLAVKLVFVAVYIVLGTFGLKRASTRAGKLLCLIGALATFALIVTIAVSHSPLGPLAWVMR